MSTAIRIKVVKVSVAGVGSRLPARSVARTSKWCSPGESPAWLSAGTRIRITGWASESGDPAHNAELSNRRAEIVAGYVRTLRPRNPIDARGAGIGAPARAADPMEAMAMNRSVEIAVEIARAPEVPDRDAHWAEARRYLEQRVGGPVGGTVDQIWTPLASGIVRLMPRMPGDYFSPERYGNAVPAGPVATRPASAAMPAPHFETVQQLGDELERAFRRETQLNDAIVHRTVERFIADGRFAVEMRNRRLRTLELQTSQGLSGAVDEELRHYREFEASALRGDPTCIWRYIDP